MSLPAMLDDLPTACDVGMKKDSKGYKSTWVGYKLHIDVADGQIPISCLLTSASLHDSQAAIPLATLSAGRTTNLYDLMDAAYDAEPIRQHSRSLSHVPLIDTNPRRDKTLAEELRTEARRLKNLGFQLAEQVRYNERTAGERVNGRLKRVRRSPCPGPWRLESDVSLHVRRARTHRRPARTPGDITSAPPATPLGARPASVTHRCSDARSATRRNSYFHLSACRRSSGAGIQSAIQGEWVFTRRIEDCAKPPAPEFRKRLVWQARETVENGLRLGAVGNLISTTVLS